MTALVYGVFAGPAPVSDLDLRGVDGGPVRVVASGDLCAATSSIAEEVPVATVARVQAHERVVAAVFADRTVVPMRFGSSLEDDAHVVRFLDERRDHLRALLAAVEGCAEMGIRVLEPPAGLRPSPAPAPPTAPAGPGRAYLAALRERYAVPAQAWQGELVARCRRAFEGLYVRCKVEEPVVTLTVQAGDHGVKVAAADGRSGRGSPPALLSVSFLVPRGSVAPFQQAFRRLAAAETAVLSSSGPWPPYSFVTP